MGSMFVTGWAYCRLIVNECECGVMYVEGMMYYGAH